MTTTARQVPEDGGFGHKLVTAACSHWCVWCEKTILTGERAVTWSWQHWEQPWDYDYSSNQQIPREGYWSVQRDYMHQDCWDRAGFKLEDAAQ